MNQRSLPALFVSVLCVAMGCRTVCADDWPGWRGPQRDGISRETGLLQEWPEGGPRLLWQAKGLGEGYSAPSVVGDRAYTMGNRGLRECVIALDVSRDGQEVWAFDIGRVRHEGGGYPGPRATPTIDSDRLYTLGCADRAAGLVAAHDDLEDVFPAATREFFHSHVIDDQQIRFEVSGQHFFVAERLFVEEVADDVKDRTVVDYETLLNGLVTQGLNQERLAHNVDMAIAAAIHSPLQFRSELGAKASGAK